MEKTEKKGPTKEQMTEWVKKDLAAASAFLHMLMKNPDIVAAMASDLYDRYTAEEQGALIDKIGNKGKEDKNGIHN